MSKNSDLFVDQLKAAFQFMGQDAMILYKKKLSRLNCTARIWESVLDKVIQDAESGRIPELKDIYAEIKRQQEIEQPEQNMGFAYFRLGDNDFAIRIYAQNRQWLIADVTREDVHGIIRHIQPSYGNPVVDHIPGDATYFHIAPDKPASPEPYEMPSDLEREQYLRAINKLIGKIGRAA